MSLRGRFEGYRPEYFRHDLIAGLIVGIVAIPLGMAFAIASGVKPEYGIYTTIFAGMFISLFGGSKYQIGGPTGAFIPVLLAVVLEYGYENLLVAGFMAGVMLVLMGMLRLGAFVRFIPKPVVTGFTAGIAVIIFSSQIGNFLGLEGVEKHEFFHENMAEIAARLHTVNAGSVAVAFLSLGVLLLFPRWFPKIPAPLAAILISAFVSALWIPGVPTIGTTYGEIPQTLPSFHFPDLSLERMLMLLEPAFVIAMLGGVESLLSAVVADRLGNSRHNSNRELIGQGIANMVAPLFGGIPATGAIARTATNIKSGARSPLSGVIHSLVVLLVLLLLAPYASHIPLAGMAPILMIVAWNMSERKHFAEMLKAKTGDSLVLLTTFLATVLIDLTTGVLAGLCLSVILFVFQMIGYSRFAGFLPGGREGHCPQMSIFALEGPLFFGNIHRVQAFCENLLESGRSIILLKMKSVPLIDLSAAEVLKEYLLKVKNERGCHVLVCGLKTQPKYVFEKVGIYEDIGRERFFETTENALFYAFDNLNKKSCNGCKQLVFRECPDFSGQAPEPLRLPGTTGYTV